MDGYFKLNQDKLRIWIPVAFIFCWLFIGFLLLAINLSGGKLSDPSLLIWILLIGGIGFPIFLHALNYLKWRESRWRRFRALKRPPFNNLEHLGFEKASLYSDSKWLSTAESKSAIIDGFNIAVDSIDGSTVEFTIELEPNRRGREVFKRLNTEFARYNVEIGIDWSRKIYNSKKPPFETVEQLKVELESFITLLKNEGFEPRGPAARS